MHVAYFNTFMYPSAYRCSNIPVPTTWDVCLQLSQHERLYDPTKESYLCVGISALHRALQIKIGNEKRWQREWGEAGQRRSRCPQLCRLSGCMRRANVRIRSFYRLPCRGNCAHWHRYLFIRCSWLNRVSAFGPPRPAGPISAVDFSVVCSFRARYFVWFWFAFYSIWCLWPAAAAVAVSVVAYLPPAPPAATIDLTSVFITHHQ